MTVEDEGATVAFTVGAADSGAVMKRQLRGVRRAWHAAAWSEAELFTHWTEAVQPLASISA